MARIWYYPRAESTLISPCRAHPSFLLRIAAHFQTNGETSRVAPVVQFELSKTQSIYTYTVHLGDIDIPNLAQRANAACTPVLGMPLKTKWGRLTCWE